MTERGPLADRERLFEILDLLIDRWCERRALLPLGVVLAGYPPVPRLTDEWALLYQTIRNLKGLPWEAVPAAERAEISEAHALIYQLLKASEAGAQILKTAR
jgi:hypothetical protein